MKLIIYKTVFISLFSLLISCTLDNKNKIIIRNDTIKKITKPITKYTFKDSVFLSFPKDIEDAILEELKNTDDFNAFYDDELDYIELIVVKEKKNIYNMNAKITGYFLFTPDIQLPIIILEDKGYFLGHSLYYLIILNVLSIL